MQKKPTKHTFRPNLSHSQVISSRRHTHARKHTHTRAQTLRRSVVILGLPPCATWGNPLCGRPAWFGFACHRAGWRWLQRPRLKDGPRWAGSAAGRRPQRRAGPFVRGRGMLRRTASGLCRSLPGGQKKKNVGVGTHTVTGEELQGVFLKNTPLWRCRRPWPRPLWGQLAEQPCGAGWVGRDPLWWPDGSGAEWERGCHTPSLQWPTGHAIEEKNTTGDNRSFFFNFKDV